MQYLEDYSDERNKAWCIHCQCGISDVLSNRDHVPSKSLLSKQLRERGAKFDRGHGELDDYLPQVTVCKNCNAGFSEDENYFLCVLHAVVSGTLYPDPHSQPEAHSVLRSNRNVVRALKAMPDGQLFLFRDLQPFTIYPDLQRIQRMVIKNARGHAYHEIGEPMLNAPVSVWMQPIEMLSPEAREAFESFGGGIGLLPEVGSRMMSRLIEGNEMIDGWIEVEEDKYRYALDWSGGGITVRTVIWNYLATETQWTN